MNSKLTSFFSIVIGIVIGIALMWVINPHKRTAHHISQNSAPKKERVVKLKANKAENSEQIKLTQKQAISIFQKLYANSKIFSINLTKKHGFYYYEIDGFDQVKECNIKIDAKNGKIISQATVNNDYTDEDYEELKTSKLISRQTATDLALQKVGSGEAESWQLENNSNFDFPIWIVEIVDGQEKYSVKINAKNKEIIE